MCNHNKTLCLNRYMAFLAVLMMAVSGQRVVGESAIPLLMDIDVRSAEMSRKTMMDDAGKTMVEITHNSPVPVIIYMKEEGLDWMEIGRSDPLLDGHTLVLPVDEACSHAWFRIVADYQEVLEAISVSSSMKIEAMPQPGTEAFFEQVIVAGYEYVESDDGQAVLMATGESLDEPMVAEAALVDAASNQASATPMAGTSRLVWRHESLGIISCWNLADTAGSTFTVRSYDKYRLSGGSSVSLDSNWNLSALCALDADGVCNDYVWHNPSLGYFSVWRMADDPRISNYGKIQYEAAPDTWSDVELTNPWKIVGVAALDNDTLLNDVIWHHPSQGIVSRWEIGTNGNVSSFGRIQYDAGGGNWQDVNLGSSWVLGCVADLEGDGKRNDFIWQHTVTGAFSYWKVNGSNQITEFGKIQYESSPGNWADVSLPSPWTVVGVCELDGDGALNDVIWHQPSSGIVSRWNVDSNGRVTVFGRIKYDAGGGSWQNISLSSPWSMRGVASLDGDGIQNDLVWHNASMGRFSCWRLTLSGDDTRIAHFGPFRLNGSEVLLNSPWEIAAVIP